MTAPENQPRKHSTLALALSQEELLVVLAYLEVDQLPGLEKDFLGGLPPEVARHGYLVAERALVARNFLRRGTAGRLQLDSSVLAVVGTCARPERTVVVCRRQPDIPEACYYFHASRRMNVLHSIPLTSIHQFIAYADRRLAGRALLSILSLRDQDVSNCPPGSLPASDLRAAATAVQSGEDASKLKRWLGSLPSTTATYLASSLSAPVAHTTLAFVAGNGRSAGTGFALLEGVGGLFLLEPDSLGERTLVSPTSSAAAIRRALELLDL